ncbi:MAG: hypothetical protein PVS3B1_22800 [Ktedonobacteraceae bacterium]
MASAFCIEVGNDFTLPYYRDLGVVLTIGMTPYEVFRTYLQTHQHHSLAPGRQEIEKDETLYRQPTSQAQPTQHWGYHKHNIITGATPVATQLLHAAGIAFASKLRKAAAVTVAYCGDDATNEPDFLESLRFAAQHKLPAVFICEQDCSQYTSEPSSAPSCTQFMTLPADLLHERINGADVVAVYSAMQMAMQRARAGSGPTLLEMYVTRPLSYPLFNIQGQPTETSNFAPHQVMTPLISFLGNDPLVHCQRYLEGHGAWDTTWATRLMIRLTAEVEQARRDALRDTLQATS